MRSAVADGKRTAGSGLIGNIVLQILSVDFRRYVQVIDGMPIVMGAQINNIEDKLGVRKGLKAAGPDACK